MAIELARRRPASEATETLRQASAAAFSKKRRPWLLPGIVGPFYADHALSKALETAFGDLRLTSPDITTGVGLVLTDFDIGQYLYVANNREMVSRWAHVPVAKLLRSAVAPPIYLEPVLLQVDGHQEALCGSGEVSIGTDPSLAILTLATSPDYSYNWRLGRFRISLTSVGASPYSASDEKQRFRPTNSLQFMVGVVQSLRNGAENQTRQLMRALTGEGGVIGATPLGLTYTRHEVRFSSALAAELGMSRAASELKEVPPFDSVIAFDSCVDLGQALGNRTIDPRALPDAFDVRAPVI